MNTKLTRFHPSNFPKSLLLWVGVFGLIGVGTLLLTHAATSSGSIEPEDGNRDSNAQLVTDPSVSGGKAIQFSAAGSGMQLVSRGVPLFTATNSGEKETMRDTDMPNGWNSVSLPTWAAFDLSSLTTAQKQHLMMSIYGVRGGGYELGTSDAYAVTPTNYVIETNAAAGGGSAPTTGWTAAVTINNNLFQTTQHTFTMTGANWARLRVTNAIGGATSVTINLDVYTYSGSLPSDDWLMMGDSITHISAAYWTSDIQKLVSNQAGGRWPAVIEDGIGGSGASSAQSIIAGRLANFPGKYVALGYGTNDGDNGFGTNMENLVKAVIAAGKTPVVPHMPWSSTKVGTTQNQQIDTLYNKYPQILRGPDFWQIFLNRTDLIPTNDVHPNGAGTEVWRQSWANIIAAQPK